MRVGLEYLPRPIIEHVRRNIGARISIPHVYHVTELCYCLKKAYFKRRFPEVNQEHLEANLKSLLNIYRGRLFDDCWTPLFEVNQQTFIVSREGVSVVGTLDFVHEGVLHDLKVPASVYYKKKVGAGQGYRRQVQAYLALAHANKKFLEITSARVVMVAEDCVIDDVEEDPEILEWFFMRALALDFALHFSNPTKLEGPEESWECKKDYCPFCDKCKETET